MGMSKSITIRGIYKQKGESPRKIFGFEDSPGKWTGSHTDYWIKYFDFIAKMEYLYRDFYIIKVERCSDDGSEDVLIYKNGVQVCHCCTDDHDYYSKFTELVYEDDVIINYSRESNSFEEYWV